MADRKKLKSANGMYLGSTGSGKSFAAKRRYYIETDTWTDEDGNTHTDSYRVYYDYYICNEFVSRR